MEVYMFIAILLVALYIVWNCDIPKSTVALIVFLGILIYVTVYPGFEQFDGSADDFLSTYTDEELAQLGIKRPSVYNCMKRLEIDDRAAVVDLIRL